MKSLARLILLFCITLLIVSSSVAAISYFYQWIRYSGSIPPVKAVPLLGLIESFVRSIPFAFYTTMAAALGYTVRRGIPAPAAYVVLPVLSILVTGALYWGADALIPPAAASQATVSPSIAAPGLIVPHEEGLVVYTGESSGSPVFVFADGRTEKPPATADLALEPPTPRTIGPILQDFIREADKQGRLWDEGLITFAVNIGAHAFMLASLRFIFGLTAWPLANTLFGMLLFRWVLSFDLLVHSEDFSRYASRVLPSSVPEDVLPAAVMLGIGLLMILYTFLSFMAGERNKTHG